MSINEPDGKSPKQQPALKSIQSTIFKLFDLQHHLELSDMYLPLHHPEHDAVQVAASVESLIVGYRYLDETRVE